MNNEPDEFNSEEIPDFFSIAEQIARPTTLSDIHAEQVRQAKVTFNVGVSIGMVGAVVWLVGVVLLLFFGLPTARGGITVASGQLTNILGYFMINFHRETNNRLDDIRRDERAIELVAQIQDRKLRDEAISNLVKAMRKGRAPGAT